MKKYLLTILSIATLLWGCTGFDDSDLQDRVANLKERIAAIQNTLEGINGQISALSELTSGNVITGMTQDSEGNYVVTYLDSKNESKTVVIASKENMLNVPILGVKKDESSSINYWTITIDGKTSFLLNEENNKVPVNGDKPLVSVDQEGYWTVNGTRILNEKGQPIPARDGDSSIFKNVNVNNEGDLVLILGNGSSITLPMQNVLNMTLSAGTNTTVTDASLPFSFTYELSGTSSKEALTGIAYVSGLTALLDKATKTVKVNFPESFKQGYVIMLAYDMAEHTVLRPIFFTKAASNLVEISNAAELIKFAADVNSMNGTEYLKAVLTKDIDMSGISDWTPIGNGSFLGSTSNDHVSSYSGPSYHGEFDGQGHSILNFKMVSNLDGSGKVYGLFGIIDGGSVKNLTMGSKMSDASEFTVSANGTADCGVIAGVCFGSTIQDCVNHIPIVCNGNSTDNVRMTAAMIGFLYGGTDIDNISIVTRLTNQAPIVAKPGANTKNGATSVQVAGIVGLANTPKEGTSVNVISDCVNDGNMQSNVARTSGIVASANMHLLIKGCTNNGDQFNDCPLSGGGRLGNITCICGAGVTMDNCINNGNIVTTNAATQLGGLSCLLNDASVVLKNNENYGKIIGDITTYKGTLAANLSKFGSLDKNIAGGSIGIYNGGNYIMSEIDANNFMQFIGKYATTVESLITNTIFSPKTAQ